MIKFKLKKTRIEKGFSLDEIAEIICKDKSAYCRKKKVK